MMKITLKNLHEATEQQVFDQVAEHLLTQMKKSRNTTSIDDCLYRGPEGLKCAAGCLIADDEYVPEMETKTWYKLTVDYNISSMHRSLIMELQRIHDKYEPNEYKRKLKDLSENYDLEWNFDTTDFSKG